MVMRNLCHVKEACRRTPPNGASVRLCGKATGNPCRESKEPRHGSCRGSKGSFVFRQEFAFWRGEHDSRATRERSYLPRLRRPGPSTRKYLSRNAPSRPGSGPPHLMHVISSYAATGGASIFTTLNFVPHVGQANAAGDGLGIFEEYFALVTVLQNGSRAGQIGFPSTYRGSGLGERTTKNKKCPSGD